MTNKKSLTIEGWSKELDAFLSSLPSHTSFAHIHPRNVPSDYELITIGDKEFIIPKGDGETFTTVLLHFVDVSGKSDSEIYKAAGISRQLFSKIRSAGSYHPKKETVFSLCLALRLGEEEARMLLCLAGFSFSSAYPLDNIVLFCLKNHLYQPELVNGLLEYKGIGALLPERKSRK